MNRVPKVLIACEESQAICIEMRKLGIEAYSCDLQPCSGGHPEWHIRDDVTKYLSGNVWLCTEGITFPIIDYWDMIIAHPPCTDLASSGARWFPEKIADGRQQASIDFFMKFTNLDCPRVAIENPIGIMSKRYRKPDQIIQPYWFGDPAKKSTCLWLKGLPPLKKTNLVEPKLVSYKCKSGKIATFSADYGSGGGNNGKRRSKTYPGFAKAVAEQWGGLLLKECDT